MQTNQTVIAGPTLIPDRPGYVAYRISGDTCFEVPASYHVLRAVGTGAYGVVAAAEDTRTGQRVAIKKITGVYNNLTDALRVLLVCGRRCVRAPFRRGVGVPLVLWRPPPRLASLRPYLPRCPPTTPAAHAGSRFWMIRPWHCSLWRRSGCATTQGAW